MPTPKRAQKNAKALGTMPLRKTQMLKAMLDQPMTGPRRKRSASHPIGTAPSTTNAAEIAPMKVITPSPTPNVSRMSGASSAKADDWSSSIELRIRSTTNVAAPPPMASPWRRLSSSLPTPGNSSSANSSSSWASAASRRDASSSSTNPASAAAFGVASWFTPSVSAIVPPDRPAVSLLRCLLRLGPGLALLHVDVVGQAEQPLGNHIS